MIAKLKQLLLFLCIGFCSHASYAATSVAALKPSTLIQELGWVSSPENRCGGYYVDRPFTYPEELLQNNSIQITSDQLLFAQHGTSIGQGKVTITRYGQQLIAGKALLYRDPHTNKLSAIELIDNITLREPNNLISAKHGFFDLKTRSQTLHDILYRIAIYNKSQQPPEKPRNAELQAPRKVEQLTAWGQATSFEQNQPKIYVFKTGSYSTCPPDATTWKVKANHIEINKDTGRGFARNATLQVKGIPVFYTPYLNFPIDARRQTGFLWPTFGTSSKTGPYLRTPFYWNLAPNYDTTITPAYLGKRGAQIADLFRYLTPISEGNFNIATLPKDREFENLQLLSTIRYQNSTDPAIQAELRRLQKASSTRSSLSWQNNSRFNEHWSDDIDFNYVSDDYYLRDLSNNLNEVTQNQLLQQFALHYQNTHWNFLGRAQSFQTLHPVDEVNVNNQYSRLPQLLLEGHNPHGPAHFEYFVTTELTHFDIRKNPGDATKMPIGNRLHIQPGIAYPFYRPYFYFTPRLQFAMTKYELDQVKNTDPKNPNRTLPIFDIHSGLYFDRNLDWFSYHFQQTLEPQIYYTYVPFRDQSKIPIFDTTINTLNYDELFSYNRFSGFDRIGDANQMSLGITTRFIDPQSGFEKLRAGFGEIFYFANRRVTLCNSNDPHCTTNTPNDAENRLRKSPLSGVLAYTVNPFWSLTANSIWNPQINKLDNQTFSVHFQEDPKRIINLGYTFVRNGDQIPGNETGGSSNLSQTDLSFSWPLLRDWSAMGRWTQNWNRSHFQNLLYGLEYDSCCWAVRLITGRAFTHISPNNTYQYDTQFFIQFALKGLGNVGTGDPSQILSNSITGYKTQFGQDF